MNLRINKIKDIIKENNCDSLIVIDNSDIRYLSGLVSSNIVLLITLDKSYLFLFDTVDERFKTKHSKLNIYNRNDREIQKRISHLLVD